MYFKNSWMFPYVLDSECWIEINRRRNTGYAWDIELAMDPMSTMHETWLCFNFCTVKQSSTKMTLIQRANHVSITARHVPCKTQLKYSCMHTLEESEAHRQGNRLRRHACTHTHCNGADLAHTDTDTPPLRIDLSPQQSSSHAHGGAHVRTCIQASMYACGWQISISNLQMNTNQTWFFWVSKTVKKSQKKETPPPDMQITQP